ncbi:MAG: pyrroloquinoline quinone-dependent dehydrogenase [Gammaproteobacteria bacterium]
MSAGTVHSMRAVGGLLACALAAAGAGGHRCAAAAGTADWPVYLGDRASSHYSALDQINRDNVAALEVAWTFDAGDAFQGSELQCNPLVIDGVLYGLTASAGVVALDAATGAQRWRFDSEPGARIIAKSRHRGLAYWVDGEDRRIFVGVRNRLYALDARTGAPIAGFGNGGAVDLRNDLHRDPKTISVALHAAPAIWRDLVIVGSSVGEQLPTAPGDIRAYDARTGALRWSFHTIPKPGEHGHDTWPEGAHAYAGAANNWAGMALDAERGLVFVPTGSAASDYYGADRHGDNLFANTLLALDAATGRRVWHFQTVRHDLNDRDLPAPPNLVQLRRDGRTIDAVAQVTKTGYVFVFDRETGAPLFPIDEQPVEPSPVPGERAAKTQPVPRLPAPFARQSIKPDMITRRTPAAHDAVAARLAGLRRGGPHTPFGTGDTLLFPGLDGGAEWGGAAYDPESGWLYVNANEMPYVYKLGRRDASALAASARALVERECTSCHGKDLQGDGAGAPALAGIGDRYGDVSFLILMFQGNGRMPSFARLGYGAVNAIKDYVLYGRDSAFDARPAATAQDGSEPDYLLVPGGKLLDPDGYPGITPPWGTLNAIDLNTGRYAWKIPLGEYPALRAQGVPATGTENYGGAVVTAGGLVFIGATIHDRKFRAFDKRDGRLLWEYTLPAAAHATPATYAVDGRQFVVVAAGGGKSAEPGAAKYIAFALPGTAPAAPSPARTGPDSARLWP